MAQTAQQQPGDGPDLGPEPGDTITMTHDELAAAVREQVAEAMRGMRPAAARRPGNARQAEVPKNRHQPPSEPTYEPPFIPGPEDYAAANAAANRGELADEPIPVGGTIVAIDLDGEEHVVTPKAFRTLYAGRGWVAHPEDAKRGLAGQPGRKRRRRGGGNIVDADTDHEQAAPSRRRRRRNDGD